MKMLISGLLIIAVIVIFAFLPKIKTSSTLKETGNETRQGIQFIEADWDKALTEAKMQKKLIFLDAYA